MSGGTGLAVIIVNYRTAHHSVQCVRALARERQHLPDLEVVLVDNASGDGSPDIMAGALADLIDTGFVRLLPLDLNGGFGWANNQAMLELLDRTNPPQFIMLLNPDCTIEEGAAASLREELMAHDRCAVAGSQLLDPDGSVSGSAFRFPTIGRELVRGAGIAAVGRVLGIAPTLICSDRACEAEWVTGASCLFRTQALIENGLFDDGFFLYFEEVELMFRLRQAGWAIRHVPASRVFHIGGASTGVREGKSLSTPSLPLYWFQSRRRFLTLAYRPLGAWLASIAWLAGVALSRIAALFQPSRSGASSIADVRHMLDYGLYPDEADQMAAIIWKDGPKGQPPYWMRAGKQVKNAG